MWKTVQVNEVKVSGKSQDDVVSLLRSVDVGNVVSLTVSRQTSDEYTTARPSIDQADSVSHDPASTTAPPGEPKEKQSHNGASSPALRCLTVKTDENGNPVVDGNLELIELRIAVGDDESESSSGLGVSIKGVSAGQADQGLFIKRIIEGRAAAKVGVCSRVGF